MLGRVDTLLLDAGNTLVSMDPRIVADALAGLGIQAEPEAIDRAEAAARPALSAWIAGGRSSEAGGTRLLHLRGLLAGVLASPGVTVTSPPVRVGLPAESPEMHDLARRLLGRLRASVSWDRLWSRVLPGVPAALAELRTAGLRLAVVSNSDGSVERKLRAVGLRDFLDVVIDSAVVHLEKPDPAIFTLALERLGAVAETCVHVGDLYSVDVVGARAAGIKGVLLDPFSDWGPLDCPVVPDLTALTTSLLRHRDRGVSRR